MAVVKVSGVVSKVFGASSQGLNLVEKFQAANGEEYSRSWSVWFAVAHNIAEGSEITVLVNSVTRLRTLKVKMENLAGKSSWTSIMLRLISLFRLLHRSKCVLG